MRLACARIERDPQGPEAEGLLDQAAAGDLLNELGYVRAVPQPQPETLKHVARMREAFTYQVLSERKRLPHRW